MSLVTSAGAAPIFLGIPLVNGDSDRAAQIIATSMQGIVHRIYQLDPTAYWVGSLGADDTKTEKIVMGLYAGSLQVALSVDTIILLNHNLNNFLVEYCTDFTPGTGGNPGTGTWQTVVNVTGQAGKDYYYFAGSPIANVNGLRLTMTTTSPANQNKQLGNFIAALSNFQLSNPPSKIKPTPRQRRIDVRLPDGTIDSTLFLWSDNSFTLFDIEMLFEFLNVYNATDKASLDSIFLAGQPFLLIPEPGDVPRNVYLCLIDPASYIPVYQQQWKGGGYSVPLKFSQVGFI